MADRSRIPLGHVRQTFVGKTTDKGITCLTVERMKKDYVASFSDKTIIKNTDLYSLYKDLRTLYKW